MKKIYLIPLLGMLMASCSSETGKEPGTGEKGTKEARSFLNVAIQSPHAVTRAEGYIDGSESENKINKVRFYFFNDDGAPVMVSKSNTQEGVFFPYIDWTPTNQSEGSNSQETVEKIISTTIGITQPANSTKPTLVLAVINPTSGIMNLSTATSNPNLESLRNYVADFYDGLHTDNFVITNSVYVNDQGKEISATPLEEENFAQTEEEAKTAMKVEIYVERVLARLDFNLNLTNTTVTVGGKILYKVGDTLVNTDNSVSAENEEVFVELLGWNITQTPSASRLVKTINANWGKVCSVSLMSLGTSQAITAVFGLSILRLLSINIYTGRMMRIKMMISSMPQDFLYPTINPKTLPRSIFRKMLPGLLRLIQACRMIILLN